MINNWPNVEKCLEDEISIQVLAAIIMASGAVFPDGFREKAIEAAHNDKWAKTNKARKQYIDEYRSQIERYQNKPVFLRSPGLFEKAWGNC